MTRAGRHHRVTTALLAVIFCVVPFVFDIDAHASGPEARVFVVFDGEHADTLQDEARRFQARVLELEALEFAGTSEMEAVYAACTDDIGVNADARRECQLRAANRIMVGQILELGARKLEDELFEMTLEVWSPESNSLLYVATVEVEAGSVARAAREGLVTLAERYLCWRGVDAACPQEPTLTRTPPPTPDKPAAGKRVAADDLTRHTTGRGYSIGAPAGWEVVGAHLTRDQLEALPGAIRDAYDPAATDIMFMDVAGTPAGGFKDNINVVRLDEPLSIGADLMRDLEPVLLDQYRDLFAHFELASYELATFGSNAAIRLEATYTLNQHELLLYQALVSGDDQALVITCTMDRARADARKKTCDQVFSSVDFD